MRLRPILLLAVLSLLPYFVNGQQGQNLRKPTAEQISSEITRLALRRVYVSDFLDASGQRTPTGAYFAAAFSKLLRQPPHTFAIISRFNAHKFLDDSGWTDQNISNPDVLAKFATVFNPDAFLSGVVVPGNHSVSIDLVLTDIAGKELFRIPYREELNEQFDGNFPPATNASGRIFYFYGLDGTDFAKCVYCPNPSYSDSARRAKISGAVVISGVVTPDGRIEQTRIIKSLDSSLDKVSLENLKNWRFVPAKDPEGNPVPMRIQLEVSFRLR
jgi:TonB family protein